VQALRAQIGVKGFGEVEMSILMVREWHICACVRCCGCVRMGDVLLHDCMCESRGVCIFCMYVFRNVNDVYVCASSECVSIQCVYVKASGVCICRVCIMCVYAVCASSVCVYVYFCVYVYLCVCISSDCVYI